MDAKSVPYRGTFPLLLLILSTVLPAQEKIPGDGYTEEGGGKPRIFQRLSWVPEEYALRYEVRIEQLSPEGTYRPVLQQSTGEDHLVVSLPPGIYRYSVGSYDLLDRPVEAPPWMDLTVAPWPAAGVPVKGPAWYFSAGYEPAVPIHGQLNRILDANFYPLGVCIRFGALPFRWGNFSTGIETAAGYIRLSSHYSQGDAGFTVSGHFTDLRTHLVFQFHGQTLPVTFQMYGGGGLGLVFNFQKTGPDFKAPKTAGLFPLVTTGLSARWHISGPWYLALGMEYLFIFSQDKTNPGYLRPHIGGGIRF